MAKKSAHKQYSDITQPINEIADEINSVLDNRDTTKYFEKIVLLYSFLENLIKWMIWIKILWQKSVKNVTVREMNQLRIFCKNLSFYNALRVALSIGLIEFKLYEKLDEVREERNDVIHQLWVYTNRNQHLVLRKKLERLARVANQLVGIFNDLAQEIGADEVYSMSL